MVITLAQNLELENQALLKRDESILPTVDHGDRLIEMQGRLQDAQTNGRTTVSHYHFDTIDVSLLVPFGRQTGLSLGLLGSGTVVDETYDSAGKLSTEASSRLRAPSPCVARWVTAGSTWPFCSTEHRLDVLAPRLLGHRPESNCEDALVARPGQHEEDRFGRRTDAPSCGRARR